MIFKGKTHIVGDHIDTDLPAPARFLVSRYGRTGGNCFEGLEAGWGLGCWSRPATSWSPARTSAAVPRANTPWPSSARG